MKEFPKSFYILYHSLAHAKAVQTRLFEMGFVWGIDQTKEFTCLDYAGLVYIPVSGGSKSLCYLSKQHVEQQQFFKASEIKLDDLYSVAIPVTVVLNKEYTAEIKPDKTVSVGCQTFSFDKIKELADKVKEMEELLK